MFGKGKKNMSSTDRFVMNAGRKAGNVPRGGSTKRGSAGPDPFRDRKLSPGQVGTFKTRGK